MSSNCDSSNKIGGVDGNNDNESDDASNLNHDELYEILQEMNNSANDNKSDKKSNDELNKASEALKSPSDDNKENNEKPNDQTTNNKHVEDLLDGVYENANSIPLPDLLKLHSKTLISGFQFGEVTKRRAQENMLIARNKTLEEKRKSLELVMVENEKNESKASTIVAAPTTTLNISNKDNLNNNNQASCSKLNLAYEELSSSCSSTSESGASDDNLSNSEHKTPHTSKRKRSEVENEAKDVKPAEQQDFQMQARAIPVCLHGNVDCIEIWQYMVYKEEYSMKLRNSRLFNDFKSVTPRMRAILLDWLMEVAEVYRLRRVTYYLSVDYFDRFLSIRPDIPRSLLQLVGITCLYLAAKVEEIYPPNLSEFSYVCDGACQSLEIVSCELLLLNSLGWEVMLTTPSDWLNLYMQLHHKNTEIVKLQLTLDFNRDFAFPQYSAYQFIRASQLMDLMSLDPSYLKFGYSTIAAAAMSFIYGRKVAINVSGLTWDQLKACVDYMEVFDKILSEANDPKLLSCLGGPHASSGVNQEYIDANENYAYQTHVVTIDYFEKATVYRLLLLNKGNNQTDQLTDEETESADDDDDNSRLINELVTTKKDSSIENETTEQNNLLNLDEIYELILSHDEPKV